MLRIIDLDIDESLSADTSVTEVAWVEMPAIEQELVFFSEQRFFKAPQEVATVACRAIRENEKRGNPAATQTGKIRGQQLCNRSEISLETVKRMKSYLERAATYYTGNYDDNGTISYDLWGGKPALEWVDRILSREENFQDDGLENACWEGYEPIGMKEKDGRMVPNCVPVKDENFVYPNQGETQDEYVSRCIKYNMDEGKSQDQAIAICLNIASQEFQIGEKISLDYDGTASTARGKSLIRSLIMRGNTVYIVSARSSKDEIIEDLKGLAIPSNRIFAEGSNEQKIRRVKLLGVTKHYDNNPNVIDRLKEVGEDFDYDTGGLPPYTQYPESGATNAMLVKPILQPVLFEDCGCMDFQEYPWDECIADQLDRGYSEEVANKICGKIRWENQSKQEFELMGYVDGQPVFASREEAEIYGESQLGCSGSHEHKDENGNTVYMACETHPMEQVDSGTELEDLLVQGWEISSVGPVQNISVIQERAKEAFAKITREEFYSIVTNPNAASSLDYGNSKIRYIYAVGPGMGRDIIKTSRDFCKRMLGGRQFVFRYEDILNLNAQLTAEDTDRKIIPRPNGTSPSIFEWKGGANCRHIWIELIFSTGNPDEAYEKPITNDKKKMEREARLVSPADGQSGNVNPKARPVKGDRMEAFKKDEYSEYWDNEDLTPVGYIQGLPIFDSLLEAQDASYFLNCGGVTEKVDYLGKQRFQACSYKSKKAEMESQLFKSVDEKRMVYMPLMIPNILIPRIDEVTGERYFVKFKPEVIEKIQRKFMIEQRLRETNYEHTNKKFRDAVMVESWIVDGDGDKAYSLGFTKEQIPHGTWFAGYKILETPEGDSLWNDYIKKGKVKGGSVEGNFILKFAKKTEDEILLEEIIEILKKIE